MLDKGVPAGTPETQITGPLSEVNALSVDSGHLWIAERLNAGPHLGSTRVDKFDATSGEFLPLQLNEEGGVSFLQTGVAVGHAGGEEEVYVGAGKEGQGVVAVFDPATGKLRHFWSGAGTPNGSFTQSKGEHAGSLTGVAVDGSTNLETGGDVYVSTFGSPAFPSFNVVNVFKPAAGGEEPAKAIAQLSGTCAVEESTCPGEEVPFAAPSGVAVSAFNSEVLVTDNRGVVDIFRPTLLGEYEFVRTLRGTPTGPAESEAPFERIVAVAVDGLDGDIYVVDQVAHLVDEFDAQGKYLGRLRGTPAGPFHSLASVAVDPAPPPDPASEHVYVGEFDEERKTGKVDVFGKNIVIPDVTTSPPSPAIVTEEGQIEATLEGTVNPLGAGKATCRFPWGTSGAFGHLAPCEPEDVGGGNAPVAVHAVIKGLAPGTSYVFRLQASNENGENPGEESDDQAFLTPGPGIRGSSASEVSADSATLNATIDPEEDPLKPRSHPVSYFFQYGPSPAYGSVAPGTTIGPGEGDVQVPPRHIQGLAASTLYHYRVVAVAEVEVGKTLKALSFAGPDQTFTTQGAGALTLPDARRWELVSPPDKHGALLKPIGGIGVIQAAGPGGALSYFATQPTEDQVKGYMSLGVQVISTRGEGGWSSQNVSLPHVGASGLTTASGNEYQFFSPELSAALVEPQGAQGEFTSLAPEAFPPDTERTPYVRHDSTCAESPASCFQPLVTGAPGYADVPEGTKFGGQFHSDANFVGAAPDLAHVILSSPVALSATATNGKAQLYEWFAGKAPSEELQLVSVLPPNGKGEENAAGTTAQLGLENAVARHAVSDDGSRVVWSEFGGEEPHLYLRETAKGQSVQLDVPEAQCLEAEECGEGTVSPSFQLASRDGSRVLFSDTQRLSKDSGVVPSKSDLYECEIVEEAGKPVCALSDLTPSPGGGEAAGVQGLIGSSEDGEWLYFVADGVLGDGAQRGAVPGDCKINNTVGEGTCNLYVRHEGTTHFIAAVAGGDYPDWSTDLSHLTARVSPDGRWLAFMSQRSLTGYDNRDALSGQPDEEVFLYHAESAGSGSLACASCDPSGGRPVGVEYAQLNTKLVGGFQIWAEETWIAANVPGWTSYRQGRALYQSRYLSDEGRLFFNSRDALVAQDINNNQDVYQYEPAGVGDCTSASATFHAGTGGCTSLISSGRAAGESAFLDASESGGDVYFLTGERLVAKDVDTALDVYDAHICSPSAPCFSETTEPPPCTTAEACRSAPTPQPSIFGSPSSATFSGQGNLSAPPPPPKPELTPRQKLAKALGACRKRYKHAKKRRASCEAQAKRRYGAKSKKTAKPRKARRK